MQAVHVATARRVSSSPLKDNEEAIAVLFLVAVRRAIVNAGIAIAASEVQRQKRLGIQHIEAIF